MARLPSMADDQADAIVGVMDELQFVFSQSPDDMVITRIPMNAVHAGYLNEIGIYFSNNTEAIPYAEEMNVSYFRENIFELLYNSHSSPLPVAQQLSPFAVIPFTDRIRSVKRFQNSLPPVEVVSRVNSKEFSHLVAKDIFGTAPGTTVNSADELLYAGERLLKSGAFLIKDVFGVSGKGNLKIESEIFLHRIVKYVRKQEKDGRRTCFLVEPFLDKAFDFSCQFHVDEDGRTEIISSHKFHNSGFSFSGSRQIDDGFRDTLEKLGYFDSMKKIGSRLFDEGYFGDVCIDSMMLTDGNIIPVVEINARKSMSLINHYLDKHLIAKYGWSGMMLSFSLNVPGNLLFRDFFRQLRSQGILFEADSPQGLIPLSTNTFDVNAANVGKGGGLASYKGKFYASIISDRQDKKDSIMKSLNDIFTTMGITVTDYQAA